MKKSQLRNIIRESIKELINEQTGGGIRVRLRTCQGALQQYFCVPQGTQLGDRFTAIMPNPGLPSGAPDQRQAYVKTFLGGTCPNISPDLQDPQGPCPNCENQEDPQQFSCANVTPGCTDSTANNYDPNATVDDGSCNFGPGSFGTTGNYTVFDYPSGFDVTDWTANFIDMIINHPNPCNFLAQRIGQFYTAMGNQISFDINGNIANPQDLIVGPLQANMLMQKLVVCVELYNMFCLGTNLQEQSGNIGQIVQTAKNIKMDPKVRGIVRKAITRLRDKMSKPLGKK